MSKYRFETDAASEKETVYDESDFQLFFWFLRFTIYIQLKYKIVKITRLIQAFVE